MTPSPTRERRCIVTGEVRPVDELLRFAVAPDGNVVPDVAARLPGRGLWLLPRRDIIGRACERNHFARAARRPVALPPAAQPPAQPGEALSQAVEGLLVRRCIDLVGLARRSGGAVMGFAQVQAWLRGLAPGARGILAQAADGADGSCQRLARLAAAIPADVARVDILTAAELGQAFGRDKVVHVGLAPDARLARLFVTEARRLAGLRLRSDSDRAARSSDALEGAGGGHG